MNLYLIVGIAAAAGGIFGLIVLGWKMWYRAGKKTGAAETKVDVAEVSVKVQKEVSDAMVQRHTADELVDKWRKLGAE